jgi:hypothetical protein
MADVRPQHVHRPAIAQSLYGPNGPQQAMGRYTERPLSTRLQWPAGQPVAPSTIAEHLDSALARVPGLSSRQKTALHAVLTERLRDLSFIKLVASQLHPMQDHSEGSLP